MARHEADREDLMTEATAYVERVEFTVAGLKSIVVAGLRKDRTLTIYFDQDSMYQFNHEGRIRRALVDGVLFRSGNNTLSKLNRRRTEHETVLERNDLPPAELARFLAEMDHRIQRVVSSIDDGTANVTRVVPADTETQMLKTIAQRLRATRQASPRVARPINATR